jgi:hypothetical protein
MRSRGCLCIMVLERFFRVFFGGDEGISKALDGGGVLMSSNGGWLSAAFLGRAADRLTIEAALILSVQEKRLLLFFLSMKFASKT